MILDVVKVFLPSIAAFTIGILLTPFIANYLYKNEMWKKKAGKVALDGKDAPIFNELHKGREVGTPKMGGVVIWLSAFLTIIGFWVVAKLFPGDITTKLDFLSRNQTWIPLFTLIVGSLVGLVDDWADVRGRGDHISGGLSLKKRVAIVAIIALICSLWFFFKLDVDSLGLPSPFNELYLGWFFIPIFIIVAVAVYSGGVIDGLDGLAGGIFAIIFAAYAGVAFYQGQVNLAAFCSVMVGAILAFLWFNIPPARYYMSETGTMGLTITLSIVAFMTDSLGGGYGVLVLPVIALPLVVTSSSNIIQITSKKFRKGKKIFLVAPLHHHYEALGWPPYKVTMRFWVIGIIFAIFGMILAIIG